MGGIGVWQLVIVLAIVLVVFGTKRFKNIGSDLGGAIKGFKKSMANNENKNKDTQVNKIIDSEVESVDSTEEKSEK